MPIKQKPPQKILGQILKIVYITFNLKSQALFEIQIFRLKRTQSRYTSRGYELGVKVLKSPPRSTQRATRSEF